MDKKIIMIIEDYPYSRMVYNTLSKNYNISHVIIDNGQDFKQLLKKRIKKIGIIKVIGQILFRLFIIPFVNFKAKNRINNLLAENEIKDIIIDENKIIQVASINQPEGHELLMKINPDIVIIITHRIISKKTLELTNAKFINIHAGITPLYRGLHGGYWALINNDKTHCGVTVHLVDEGIDTGGIIYQDTIVDLLTSKDNFISYIYLQLVKALPLLKKAIDDVHNNNIKIQKPTCAKGKNLYYQPTIWFYLYNRWFRNIK